MNVGSHKIVFASEDSTISIWDAEKIKVDRHLKYHKGAVKEVCALYDYKKEWGEGPTVNPNANVILASVSTDTNVMLWDHRTAIPASKISAKQGELHSIDNVNQSIILTGGIDGTVKLWDLRQLREHLYDSKLDKAHRHTGKVKQIIVDRSPHHCTDKN